MWGAAVAAVATPVAVMVLAAPVRCAQRCEKACHGAHVPYCLHVSSACACRWHACRTGARTARQGHSQVFRSGRSISRVMLVAKYYVCVWWSSPVLTQYGGATYTRSCAGGTGRAAFARNCYRVNQIVNQLRLLPRTAVHVCPLVSLAPLRVSLACVESLTVRSKYART